MIRSAASKVAWVGRTASMVFGLALILALLFGLATTAFGANGGTFVLGKLNNAATAVTGLVGNVDGEAALRVTNPNSGTNDTALDLKVQAGEAPMRVNSAARVANLNAATAGRADSAALADTATSAQNAANAQNADTLDNKDSSEFAGASHNHDDRYYTETETENRYLAKDGKAADADKLDNLESSAFGIRTEHNREQSSACDTPGVNNNCAPVTVVVPPGKTYHVSVWSSMSWTGTSAAQDMEYCVFRIAVGGGAQGSHCITPFSILNRITLPANQRAAASVSGETTLGPGTWQLATTVTPLTSQVADSDRNWIITKVMIRDASAPAPTIQ